MYHFEYCSSSLNVVGHLAFIVNAQVNAMQDNMDTSILATLFYVLNEKKEEYILFIRLFPILSDDVFCIIRYRHPYSFRTEPEHS